MTLDLKIANRGIGWSNTTYYNDEDLQYLFLRVVNALEGLPKSQTRSPAVASIEQVWVRYYGGKKEWGDASFLWKKSRLYIKLKRRNDMFGSDIERIAALAGEEPKVPEEALLRIGESIMRAAANSSAHNALRHEYRGRDFTDPYWGFPQQAAEALLREVVLPSAQIRIEAGSRKGSAHEEALLRARDGRERAAHWLRWRTADRVELQAKLEAALEEEEKARVALLQAKVKLEKLESKK